MSIARITVLAAAIAVAASSPTNASTDRGSAADATAMLNRAHAHYLAVGREQAMRDFSTRGNGWQDRDLFIFCLDVSGRALAHGANATLVGRDLSGLRDADGKLYVAELLATGKSGGGWVDYRWANPPHRHVRQESSHVLEFGDDVCGVGVYR